MDPPPDPLAVPPERMTRWEALDAAELARLWGVPELHLFRSVGSTNDVARALAERGCAAGTCVLAEEQTAGRGRASRTWASPPGLGIWMSLVLRPAGLAAPGVLPLLVGLAAAQALDPFCRPAAVQVKWPNDLLLGGRKLGGILCEGAWEQGRLAFVVAGIGLNVLQAPEDFPAELRPGATSLRIAAGWQPPRAEVAGAVLRAVLETTRRPELDRDRLAELEARDALRGRDVVLVEPGAAPLHGRALGINADGALLLRTGCGSLRTVRSGTVRPAEVASPAET